MDAVRLGVRVTDIERVLDQFESPILGNNFRSTLPAGRIARLLVALQGQEIVSMPALESIAYKQAHISSFELKKAYLPVFAEWGFARVYDNKIEETITSRTEVLQQAGKMWEESDPNPVEKLAVDLFDTTSVSPVPSSSIQKILSNYNTTVGTNSVTHLSESGLVDKFKFDDGEWYYSPEIFGENYPKTLTYLRSQTESKQQEIRSVIESVLTNQGLPHDALKAGADEKLINQMAGAGLLMGYPLSIGSRTCPFYFTPDIRNRFDKEGRGDKFELIKAGMAHFQYAFRLADQNTGRLKFGPSVFLNSLLEKGKAGDATAIGTDYDILVKNGLVKLEPTTGNRYRFLLPESKEKIADLEAIRDAFEEKWVVPQMDLSTMGIPSTVITGDSIVYRSSKSMQAKSLAREFAKDVFNL
jgi:hypothetical protein